MESLENLKKSASTAKGSLTRIKNQIDKGAETITLPELKCRLDLLEAYFKQLLSIQESMEELDSDQFHKKRAEFEELYVGVKTKILSLIADRKSSQASFVKESDSHNQTFYYSSSPTSTLSKLKLPKFSGQYTEYPNFIQQFMSRIGNDKNISTIDKFTYLDDCLVGDAKLIIKSLDIVEANYTKALQMLKERFDNKCIIMQSHIRQIFELHGVTKNSASQLRNLVDSVDGHVRALFSLGNEKDILNMFLLHLIVSKLDNETMIKWEDSLNLDMLPTWSDCSSFLSKRCQHLENRDIVYKSHNQQFNHHHQQQQFHRSTKSSMYKKNTSLIVSQLQCSYCKQHGHGITKCKKFTDLSVMDRYFESKKLSLCLNCLSPGHVSKKCPSSKCKVCSGLHHTLLHRYTSLSQNNDQSASLSTTIGSSDQINQPNQIVHSSLLVNENLSTRVLLATAIVQIKDKSGNFVPIRVLLDSASQINFITQYAVQTLGLNKNRIHETINGIGDKNAKIKHKTSAAIRSTTTKFEVNVDLWILPVITTPQPDIKLNIDDWNIPQDISLADKNFNNPQRVDMLLGAEIFFDLILEEKIKLGCDKPTLINTVLGWIVSGNYQSNKINSYTCSTTNALVNRDEDQLINNIVQHFWKLEEVDNTSNNQVTDEQLACENIFCENIKVNCDGKLMVKLPFKRNPNELGDSMKMAERRFLNLERRLIKYNDLKVQYVEFMREYESLGHMTEIAENEISAIKYVLPHHCVIKPDSSSTKLRVVFDASAKTTSNLSLNDILMVGPTVQDELFAILLRFRSYKFAFTADISKMYRQFLVTPKDRYYQCILWRENSQEKLKFYKLNTITYGTAPAPFLATRCLNYLADINTSNYPLGSKIIKQDFYVDDLISGADTVSEMSQIRSEIENIFKSANLELRKWFSNDTLFLNSISETEREKPLKLHDLDVIKTLGIIWVPTSDEFHFITTINPTESKITKRTVLSDLSRLFDPLGLINPIIVLAKIFMQRLWILKLEWDEEIPHELASQWKSFHSQLQNLSKIQIPRYIFWSSAIKIELHGFADASLRAYGCCLYTRCEDAFGNVSINLITAKSKVAPLTTQSLPRLELNAALLLSKLLHRVITALIKNFNKIFLWTDSNIVLDWLSDHSSAWETYVANRVATIQQLTTQGHWRHVDSKSNPADIISRGSLVNDLITSQWFTGPQFLYKPENQWPKTKELRSTEKTPGRRKLKNVLLTVAETDTDFIEHNKFINNFKKKLRRIVAYCIRFFNNLKSKIKKIEINVGPLSVHEINESLLRIIWCIQRKNFCEEIDAFEKQNFAKNSDNRDDFVILPKSSKLRILNPFLDTTTKVQLLRVGGRLSNSELPDISKYPIILPKNHLFNLSYINYLHLKYFHAGAQALVSMVRQKFWMIDVKRIARKVVHSCVVCFRARPQLLQQIMGDLPAHRVRPGHPFINSGVDFCGPLHITERIRKRGPIKVYIAVFICFSTKAVHLEIVSNLSSAGFIAALKRFIGRRGICKNLYCDNATNFVGARNDLTEFRKSFHSKETTDIIMEYCSENCIEFHHIPPRSPHFGGLWEAAVKSAKHLLIRTIGYTLLTFEELNTVIIQIEAILNSRPLTSMSSDPSDDLALCPGHFLIGCPLTAMPEPDISTKVNLKNHWQQIQSIQQRFWKRWSAEYITQLQHRYKWNCQSTDIKLGTLVLVHEDNLPPQKWLLGRIVQVIPGSDNRIRVVIIRTKQGLIKRSITKTAPLPIEDC